MNESTLFPFGVETIETHAIPRNGINVFRNNNDNNNVSDCKPT